MLQFSRNNFFLLDNITFQLKPLKSIVREEDETEKWLQANTTFSVGKSYHADLPNLRHCFKLC